MTDTLKDLQRRFDHACLKPDATEADILALCKEAIAFKIGAVAVNPCWVLTAAERLQDSVVRIVSVAGFPLGANRTEIKIEEANRAIHDGASEIDMVANIGWLVSGQYDRAETEIAEVRKNLPYNAILKVIIEAAKLTPAQQTSATKIVVNAGAQFVKTGTGFFGSVTSQIVERLRLASESNVEIKAAGGIRTLNQCRELLDADAARLGSSATISILIEAWCSYWFSLRLRKRGRMSRWARL